MPLPRRRPPFSYAGKLITGFGAASLITIAVAAVGYRALGRAEALLDHALRANVQTLAEANHLQFASARLRVLEHDLLRLTDFLAVAEGSDDLRRAAQRFGSELAAFAETRLADDQPGAGAVLGAWTSYRADLDRVVEAAADMRLEDAARVATTSSQPRFRVFAHHLAEVTEGVRLQAEEQHRTAAASLRTQRHTFVGLSAAALTVALAAAFLLAQSLTARIRTLWQAAADLGAGGEEGPVPVQGRDEIADLAVAFNRMGTAVRTREEELRRAHADLEVRVQERTAELRAREAQLRKAKEIANLGSWEWDLTARRGTWSPEMARLSGNSLEALGHGPLVNRVLHPEDRETVARALRDAVSTGTFRPFEARVVRPDGTVRDTWTLGEVVIGPDGRPARLLAVTQDVTDRKRLEEDLLRSQKLEAVGLLAAGIAHDFNNLLAAILGRISLAQLDAAPGERLAGNLDAAEKACFRARDLAGRLLTFAKGGRDLPQAVALAPLIRDVGEIALVGSATRLELAGPEELWSVDGVAEQLGQVFQNLLTNAREAMPGGGRVRVSLANRVLPPDNPGGLPAGPYVAAEVADEGTGIPAHLGNRVFDLYFSTKERGADKGTGLGLAICHSIVEKHGGAISFDSPPGRGTTFHLLLPAAAEAGAAAAPAPPAPPPPSQGARILVMDDEDLVRDAVADILATLGYRVETAADGASAIARYREARARGDAFAAVILDLTVRDGMGGAETLAHLKALDPAVAAVVSSGYGNDPIMVEFGRHGFAAAVPKPYRVQALAQALTRAVDPASPR